MEKYFEVLKNNPLFSGLEKDEIGKLLHGINARVILKEADEYIFHVGDITSSMGIVLSGSVLVVQDDLWGHRNIMTRIRGGDIFAEIFASVNGAAMNVSVQANEDCEIMLINIKRLMSMAAAGDMASGQIVRNLLSLMAKKTMALNNKVTHLSKRTTRDKLLSFLSSEAIRQGKRSFDISYNRQQLADYLGVERAAMSVELSKLQKEGILSYHKNSFELKEFTD